MKLIKYLFSLAGLCLYVSSFATFASEPRFLIQTATPELTMNQSDRNAVLPVMFFIYNNGIENPGTITITDLPQGVLPFTPENENGCKVNFIGADFFSIENLDIWQSCELNLLVDRSLAPSVLQFTLNPTVCAQMDYYCSKPFTEDDIVNVYVINDFQKIVTIVFENENAADTLLFPTFKEIADNGAYFNHFHAVARPSQPNYIAMTAASTFGINHNNNIDLDETSIANLLDDNGYTWKVYAENYPGNCYTASASPDNLYRRKHNPFISYTYISRNPTRCAQIVNAQDNFLKDVENDTLPDYSFFIPNIPNSGHDGVEVADEWLRTYMYPIMQKFKDNNESVLFVLTFDESNPDVNDPGYAENKVYTVLYGAMVNTMVVDTDYNFYDLLRTQEDIWQLGSLYRYDNEATAITPLIWKN
jgi:hypothetical protein